MKVADLEKLSNDDLIERLKVISDELFKRGILEIHLTRYQSSFDYGAFFDGRVLDVFQSIGVKAEKL